MTAPSLSEMVTDGANRIGRESSPRAQATLFVVLALVAAAALRARQARTVRTLGLAAVIALALPGLYVIIVQRRGAPGRGESAAATIEMFRQQVEGFSAEHGCARIITSACVACEPVVNFALATTPACSAPAAIVLAPDALSTGCVARGDTLTCGTELPK